MMLKTIRLSNHLGHLVLNVNLKVNEKQANKQNYHEHYLKSEVTSALAF